MSAKALSYMNCVILDLMKYYSLSEEAATNAVKRSYLYESLRQNPTETMHDSVSSSAADVYAEIYAD